MTKKKDFSKETASTKKNISMNIIQKRAHAIYQIRVENNLPGDEDSDWSQAVNELLN